MPFGPRERRVSVGVILLILASVLAFAAWTAPASSASVDLIRAVYYAAAVIVLAIAVVASASP